MLGEPSWPDRTESNAGSEVDDIEIAEKTGWLRARVADSGTVTYWKCRTEGSQLACR